MQPITALLYCNLFQIGYYKLMVLMLKNTIKAT